MKRWMIFSACALAIVAVLGFTQYAQTDEILPDAQQSETEIDPPTFYADVAPILEQNCMGCHNADGIGVSFENPQDLIENADSLAFVVQNGDMPPWMPGEASPQMVGERGLTQSERDTLIAWATSGAALGDPQTMPELAPVETRQLRADMVLEMPEAYTPDDSLEDDYRCFLLDPNLDEDQFVTGYNVLPGQTSTVHHVLLFQINENSREEARARDAEDDAPGWQCFGGPGVGGRARSEGGVSAGGSIAGSIGAWVPGALPTFFPDGTGALLAHDSLIVMQVHYNLAVGASPDQTSAILQFADAGEDIVPLRAINMVAPVELPCPAGVTGELCDRSTVIADAIEVEGQRAARRPVALMAFCGKTLDDYVAQDPSQVVSSCDYPVRQAWIAVAVAGHMHELGTEITIERNPDTENAEILLQIPAWDFHWQGSYQFVEPIPLQEGDVLRITCVWDNSENDRYVTWGEGTADEMCLGAVTVHPIENGES